MLDDLLADDGIEPFPVLHVLDRAFHEGYAAIGKVGPGFRLELEVVGEEFEGKRREFRQVGEIAAEPRADIEHPGTGPEIRDHFPDPSPVEHVELQPP